MWTRYSGSTLALAAAVVAAVVARLGYPAGELDGVTVLRADFGISAAAVAIITLVSGLFGLFKGKVDGNTKFALEGMRSGITDLGRKLVEGLVGVGGLIARAVGVIKRFIERTFKPLFEMLSNLVQRVVRILDKIFGPIIDFLQKVRGHLKKFYDKVLKPIIDTIEMVRGVLRVLSFFGIEWSRTLDSKLAELEGYVLAPYLFVIGKLNEISNWINRIVTLDGLLQRLTLLQSLYRDRYFTNSLWWNSQVRPLTAAERARMGLSPGAVESTVAIKNLREHFRTGNSDASPAIRETIANIQIDLRRARGA